MLSQKKKITTTKPMIYLPKLQIWNTIIIP